MIKRFLTATWIALTSILLLVSPHAYAAQAQTISFAALPNQVFGTAPFAVSATVASGLTVAFSTPTPSVCTVSGTTVTLVDTGTCTIFADQGGRSGTIPAYSAAPEVAQSFTVTPPAQPFSQTINFAALSNASISSAPIAISATASSNLPVTFSTTTPSVCSVSGATVTVTLTGGTCTIAANQVGNSGFAAAPQVTQSFIVNLYPQTINFQWSYAEGVGTSLNFATVASASSGLKVTFSSLTPSICTNATLLIAAGTCTIAANQAGNYQYAPAPQVTQSFSVLPGSQGLTFTQLSSQNYGTPPFTVSASASTGLPVTFSSTTPSVCTVSGSTVSIVNVGTCTIAANQAGNSNYQAAAQVTQSFTVNPEPQTITFAALANQIVGGTFNVSATASSGLPVVFSATSSVCSITGSTVTLLTSGTCTISADQSGNSLYAAAPETNQSLNVGPGPQTISFAALPNKSVSASAFQVSASTSAGLPVTFTVGPGAICQLVKGLVTPETSGICTVTANQAGNANYTAAPTVTQSFTITPYPQTITFAALANQTLGAAPFTVSATSSIGWPVTFSSPTPSVCTVSGTTVTIFGGGICTIAADQSGNNGYYAAAPEVLQSFTVAPIAQTLTFTALANRTVGASFSVSASASSGLAAAFSTTTPLICTVSGTTVTSIGAGTCTIAANQVGNNSYNAAPQVTQSFTVSLGPQTVSFPALPGQSYSAAPFSIAATASSGLPVSFSSSTGTVCTVSGSTVTIVAPGTCTIAANQVGNSNYSAAPQVAQSFEVASASGLTLSASASTAAAGQSLTVTANVIGANPTGSITFMDGVTSLGSWPLTGGQATLTTALITIGTHNLTAVYSGDANNAASTSAAASVTITVAQSSASVTLGANPAGVGQSTTLTATVQGGNPTGTVTFIDGASNLGSGTLAPGPAPLTAQTTLSTSFTTAGTHSITAVYGGDSNNAGSTSAIASQTVVTTPSVTSVTVNANPVATGTSITFTVTVSGNSPTGTVNIMEGPIGPVSLTVLTLSGGKATFTGTLSGFFGTAGTHTITAVYSGDANNGSSTSSVLNLVFSGTTLAVNPGVVATGQPVAMTGTVVGKSPTGTVTFKNGSTTLGSATLAAGQANFSTSFATAGTESITATYSGDANNPTSSTANAPYSVIVTTAAGLLPSVSLTASATHLAAGGNGTAAVTITANASSSYNLITSVTLLQNAGSGYTALEQASSIYGIATPQTYNLTLPVGTYQFELTGIDSQGNSATSAAISVTVSAGNSEATATRLAVSANPVPVGQSETFTATVTGNSPTGTVAFIDGGTTIGTATLAAGQAAFTKPHLTPGTHAITVVYGGDANNTSSTSATTSLVVALAQSTTSIALGANPVVIGQNIAITASITGWVPTGTVTFMNGSTVIGSAAVSGGQAVLYTAFATAGSYSITANYSGDGNNTASGTTSASTLNVVAASATTLAGSASQIVSGQQVSFSASVSGNNPTGTVTFLDGGNTLTTIDLTAGQATLVMDYQIAGSHSITAVYNGDANNAGSSSNAAALTVIASGITLSVSTNMLPSGQQETYSATIIGINPTGTVTFQDGGASIGSSTLAAGQASFTLTYASPGMHTITAVYSGDTNNPASTSNAVTVTVDGVILAVSPNPATVGQSVSMSATVVADSPSRIVTFMDGATTLGTVTLGNVTPTSGQATFATTFSSAGTHSITAAYSGDPLNPPGTSSAVGLVVNAASGLVPTVTLSAINTNVAITSGTTAQVTFNGSAIETGGQIASLALYENNGSGWGSTAVLNGTSGTLSGQILNLTAGLYQFRLTATDTQGGTATSPPVIVNVSNSSLLGQVNGVEITTASTPQLFGWVCQSGNITGLTYQVYLNAPSTLGGTLLTSGIANVSGQPDDATVQGNCSTPGSSHDIVLDLSTYTSQYAGTPFYVQAPDINGNSIVLPCKDNTCTIPGSLRIGLSSPAPTNTDQYSAPATVFMRALLTGGSTTDVNVFFTINGPGISPSPITATADTTPGAYFTSVPNLGAGTYTVTAFVQQGNETLYSTENIVTIVPGSTSTLSLTGPTAGAQTAPVTLTATTGSTAASSAVVQFYANGVPVGSSNAINGGVATYLWTNPVAGTYVITASMLNGSAPLAQTGSTTITVSGNSVSGVSGAIGPTPIAVNVTPPYINSNPDAGSLPGSLSVGNNGAATYSIPIAVPPGTAGLAPTLALNYSSLAGNGIAGFGWSMAGGSGIHRCVRTVAQDGYAGPINLNSTDALCLDGVRLLGVTGTYGQNGATYRTELDNFARITDIGTSGPSIFKVETKAGQTMLYGAAISPNSAVQVVGKHNQDGTAATGLPTLFWDLATVTDRAGNTIQYNYSQDGTTGEHLLTSITYGNAATLYNSVVFGYECRNGVTPPTSNCTGNTTPIGDADIEYLAGARVDMRHRLKTISTFTDGNTAAQTTTLYYGLSPTSQRSLLNSIQACVSNTSTCLPATNFTWGTATSGNNTFASQGQMSNGPDQKWGAWHATIGASGVTNLGTDYQQVIGSLITGDFYGDGKQRILTADQGEGALGTPGLHIYTVNAAGSSFEAPLTIPFTSITGAQPSQLDFGVPNQQFNSAYGAVVQTMPPDNVFGGTVIVGDFDGDGKADFAFINQSRTSGGNIVPIGAQPNEGMIYVCLSRLTAAGGTFDCQAFAQPVGNPTAAAACGAWEQSENYLPNPCISGQLPQAMFLDTQANGRADLLLWNPIDITSTSNQRCSYVAPTANSNWSWSCGMYPGTFTTQNAATRLSAVSYLATGMDYTFPADISNGGTKTDPQITNNAVISATAQRALVGDFFGTGQSGFISQANVSPNGTPGYFTNSALFAAVANNAVTPASPAIGIAENNPTVVNNGGFAIVTGSATSTYAPGATNQFTWSNNSSIPANTVIQRFMARASKVTEMGGTSLGDLNGDGYTDYLLTFEGHAEICYSLGADGFDCRVMEELTPTSPVLWRPPTVTLPQAQPANLVYNTVTLGSTLGTDGNGLIPNNGTPGVGVFSVLSVGHATDANVSEVIYRRGDGGAYSYGPAGSPGANQYLVCTVRDGLKNCVPWTGPYLRPYISGTDATGYPIPGVTYIPGTDVINWPTAGSLVGDYTGHGRTEILWYCNSSCSQAGETGGWQLYTPNVSGPIDRLMQVVNGIGNTASVAYKPMSDPTVYTQQPKDGTPAVYPMYYKIDGGRMLVSQLNVDRGDNNSLTSYYTYEGLAIDPTGRGEQGFERVIVTNPLQQTHSTQYAQGFPFTGMELTHAITASNGVVLEQTTTPNSLWTITNTFSGGSLASTNIGPYSAASGYSTVVYPYTQNSQITRNDLSGTPVSQTTSTVGSIDAWGNVTGSLVTTVPLPSLQPVYATGTANQYNNMPNNPVYRIGELIYSQVTKTSSAPGLPSSQSWIARTKQFDYYGTAGTQPTFYVTPIAVASAQGAEGLLKDEITEPGNSVLSVQTTYGRDHFGNVAATTQSWQDPLSSTAMSRTKSAAYKQPQGRFPQTVTNAIGQSETHTFDDRTGAKVGLTDINGLATSWNIDGFGRTLSELPPDGTETFYYQKRCGTGNIPGTACQATTVDPSNADPIMIPVTVTITDRMLTDGVTRIAVPELNYSDSAGHHLRSQSYGFTGSEVDTDFTYDDFGRLNTTFQPTFAGTTPIVDNSKSYDELNRVISFYTLDDTGGEAITTTTYAGLSSTIYNPLQQTKTSINNAIGQLLQTVDAAGNSTYFARDADGNLVQTTDPKSNVVIIVYDNLGRKVSLQDPDLGLISYGIDPLGRQYSQVNPNEKAKGQTTTFYHDLLDRLYLRSEPDLTSYWVYDQWLSAAANPCKITSATLGKLVEAFTWTSTVTTTIPIATTGRDYDRAECYDNLSRPVGSATTLYNNVVYTSTTGYDGYDRVSTITHQAGIGAATKSFAQYYNNDGYLAQVARIDPVNGTLILWQANQQDAADRVTQAALGNGLAISRGYYPYSARLQDASLNVSPTSSVLQEGYSYDILGNVSTRTQYWNNSQSGFSETFAYDTMNRLQSSQVSLDTLQAQQTFTYDSIGDISSKTGVGNYTYGGLITGCVSGSAPAGPHAVTSIDGLATNFCYDANGNMLSGAGRVMTNWTSFDMPGTIAGSGVSSSFAYGPEHQRTRQTRGDTMIVYADAMEIDTPNGGSPTIKTYWPMGLGLDIDAPGATASALNWTHTDRLGSIVAITDHNGNLLESMAYDAWGSRRDVNGAPGVIVAGGGQLDGQNEIDNKGYTGQEMLDQLALVHLNGRVYDPFTARFISADPEIQDPTFSQSFNRYSYVWNNPTNLTDPSGFEADETVTVTGAHSPTTLCTGEGCRAFMDKVRQYVQNHEAAAIHRESAKTLRATAELATSPWNREAAGELYEEADREDKLADILDGEITFDANFVIEVVASGAKFGAIKLKGAAAASFLGKLKKAPTGRGSVPPGQRDPKRLYSRGEVKVGLEKQGGQCIGGCGKTLQVNEAQGHHNERHADGGTTTEDNLSVLCVDCHKEIHKPD